MIHQPGCPQDAGGDCDCHGYGEVWHYLWSSDGSGTEHSTGMFVGREPSGLAYILPLSDTGRTFDLSVPISGKSPLMWAICKPACPFNPEYEGERS